MERSQPAPSESPSPQKGDRVRLRIADVAFGGDGVGRIGDGRVVFVPFTAIGDEIVAELTEVKRRFARGRLVELVAPSPHRVDPRCPWFGECGGCQYQHLAYEHQLEVKRKQVRDLFERLGGFVDPPVEPVVPSPKQYGYRNRIMIRSQWDGSARRLRIGYVRADSRLVVDIEECAIAEPELNARIREAREHPPPRGGLKMNLRIPPPDWEVPAHSFFQTNFHLLPRLVETVRHLLRAAGTRHLVDAYCGVGFFGIECADLVESFVGIELDRRAVESARINAARRGISTGEFFVSRTEAVLPLFLEKFPPAETTLLFDPPRTGCPPDMLDLLRRERPMQILYVSCHPATLARDAKRLCEDGIYALRRIIPLDMFPQTQHVECVADLRRREGDTQP